MEKDNQTLSRQLNPTNVFALAFGCIIGWGSFINPGKKFLPNSGVLGTAIAMVLGALVMIVISFSYAYMVPKYPKAGGEFTFTKETCGTIPAYICGWFLIAAYLTNVPMNSTAIGLIVDGLDGSLDVLKWGFSYTIAGFSVHLGEMLFAMAVLVIFAFLNLRGVKKAAIVQTILTSLLICSVVILTVAALISPKAKLSNTYPLWGFSRGKVGASRIISSILATFAIAPWAYVGFDTIPQAAEEFNFSNRKVRFILIIAILFGCFVYIANNTIAAAAIENWPDLIINSKSTPWLLLVAAERLLGTPGKILVGVAVSCAVLSGIMGFFLASSRLMYSMSRDGYLPKFFAVLDTKYGVPRNAMIFCLMVSLCGPILGREALGWFVDMSAIGASIGYGFTCLATIKVLKRDKDGTTFKLVLAYIGVVFSLIFITLQLVPIPGLKGVHFCKQSYIMLVVWIAIGVIFYLSSVEAEEIKALYKSNDTEDLLDKKINNPLGFIFTKLFIKLKWSPNQISVLSMIIGVAGGTLFYWKNIKLNLLGIVLVFLSVLLDSTDGQVARLTNQKSKLGRFLDGIESGVVFTAINVAFSFRLYNQEIPFLGGPKWGIWIFVLAIFSEVRGMQRQCMMADYYRNIHVYYQIGHSELDRSEELALQPKGSSLFKQIYQSVYLAYTKSQEKATPAFQWFYTQTNKLFGGPTKEIRDAFIPQSKKLMPLANTITLNIRIIAAFTCVILGKIEYFYVFELLVLGLLLRVLVGRYEKIFSNLSKRFLPPENQYKKRNNFQVICFLIGIVGIAVMLAETDLSSIEWDSLLDRLPYGIAIIAVIWVVNYLLFALAYKLIIGRNVKGFTLWHNFLITLSSFALNNVTPVGFMGGEPYRIMKMKRHLGIEEATSSTISFTIMTTAAHFAFWVCGCTLFFVLFGFSKSIFLSVVMAMALLLCLAVVISFLFSNKGKFSYGILSFFSKWPLIGKLFRKILTNNADKIATIDSNIHQFQQHKLRFWAVFILTFIVRIFEGVELYVLLRVLGLDEILLIQALFTMAMTSLVGNILFIIPMQLGAREGGAALALRWLGFEGSLGMTATLLARLREICFTLLGVLIIQLNNKKEDE